MIGLAKACSGGGALANYVLDEKKGYELDRNNVCGVTSKEIVEEFKMIQDLNQRATNKTFSLVLSPDSKEGKNLSDAELKSMTLEYMTKLGIDPEKQQYVAFVHTEKEHKHIHIIANRVEPSGKLISDHHIGKRGQWIAHDIAKEKGLISAKEKMFENIKNIEQNIGELKVLKNEIFKKHQEVMRDKPRTFDNYIKQMNSKGLEAKPTINSKGEIQGFRILDVKTNQDFKASEINSSMSAGNLVKQGLKNDLENQLNSTLQITERKQITQEKNVDAAATIQELKNTEPGPKTVQEKIDLTRNEADQKTQQIQEKPKTKLIMEEEREIEHVKNYNNSITAVITKHEEEFGRGNAHPNTDKIFKDNGFEKSGTNEFTFNNNGFITTQKSDEFEKAKVKVGEQLETHKFEIEKQKSDDVIVLQEKPKKSIFGISDKEKEFNKNLTTKQENSRNRQKNNQYKTFKPSGYGLEKEKFTKVVKTEIKQKQAKIEQEKIKEKEQENAIKRAQNQDKNQNKGLKL